MLERARGRREANSLLSLLPDDIRTEIEGVSTPIKLALGDVLVAAGAPIERVFFLSSGIASVVVVTKSGRKIEAGIVGREGFVPTSAVAGAEINLTEIVVQAPGDALVMDIAAFDKLVGKYRLFFDILVCALHISRTQVEHTASSNATQSVTERLARWLLMCHDRIEGDHLLLTHDFLSTMLAVRRASVTDALHVLESQGYIRSERGRITIRNRETLQTYASDLYGMPEDENNRILARFLPQYRSDPPFEDLTAV